MTTPAPTEEDLKREQRLQRNLKILVSALGALIVLGIVAVGWRATTVNGPPQTASGTVTAVAKAGGEIALELPRGAKIVAVSISGNRLAVTHESPAGTGIAVLDLETGRRIADVKTFESIPKN